jgi:uncharacterized membrane protein
MPYQWTKQSDTETRLELWPYRSLPKRGFVVIIGVTAAMISLPLASVLGTSVLWGLLPFLIGAVAFLWWALNRSYEDGSILEQFTLDPQTVRLVRHTPRKPKQEWEANPYWVKVTLHPKGGPVDDYLTLSGGPREVEIGSFLTAQERGALYSELRSALGRVRQVSPTAP